MSTLRSSTLRVVFLAAEKIMEINQFIKISMMQTVTDYAPGDHQQELRKARWRMNEVRGLNSGLLTCKP